MGEILSVIGLLLAIIAIGIPIWWDNRQKLRDERENKQRELVLLNQKKQQLLYSLKEAMSKNLQLVTQAGQELKDQTIFYNVDTTLLEATASLKYELITNIELNRLVDSVRYELDHFRRKLDLQLETWIASQENAEQIMEDEQIVDIPNRRLMHTRGLIISSVFLQMDRIKQEINYSLELIDREISVIDKILSS